VALYEGDGRVHAAVGLSNPGRLMRFRAVVEEQAPWDRAMEVVAQLQG
jgi:hypothetical protein